MFIDDGYDGDFSLTYDGTGIPSKLNTTIEGLESRTIYRIKVLAINKSGEGANSTETTCYTATIPGQPGTPRLVTSTSSSI